MYCEFTLGIWWFNTANVKYGKHLEANHIVHHKNNSKYIESSIKLPEIIIIIILKLNNSDSKIFKFKIMYVCKIKIQ